MKGECRTNRMWIMAMLAASLSIPTGCGSEQTSEIIGGSISGKLKYGGDFDLSNAMVMVSAFSTFPPQGPPNAMENFQAPQLQGDGMSYQLNNIPAGDYHVIARLVDLNSTEEEAVAQGGYPDFCTFSQTTVTVVDDQVTSGIELELFDQGGNADPCTSGGSDLTPAEGKATVAVTVKLGDSGFDPGANDSVLLGLMTSWPPMGPPAAFKIVMGDDLVFPLVIVNNAVAPGSYAVSLCIDVNGDSLAGCNGEGDMMLVHDEGTLVDFTEGDIIEIDLEL
jgi:hypothetical protein